MPVTPCKSVITKFGVTPQKQNGDRTRLCNRFTHHCVSETCLYFDLGEQNA